MAWHWAQTLDQQRKATLAALAPPHFKSCSTFPSIWAKVQREELSSTIDYG